MAKPISETIRMFQGGDFNIKAGKLTITLDVKQQNGAVSVLAKVTD